jgi:endonuclease/exonuclease/phosphatase family metal-dependent hydrolase
VDGHLTANALCVDIGVLRVLALRVPAYEKRLARQQAWDWMAEVAAGLQQCGRPSIIVGDLNTSLAASGARRMEQFHRLLSNGWTRAQPVGAGSYCNRDAWSELDHVLATASCRVSGATYVQRTNSYALAGTAGSLSDHAGLMFTARSNGNASA